MEEKPRCSFCGKESEKLIFGEFGAICPDCAKLLQKFSEENFVEHSKLELGDIPTPVEMKKFLDQYVIGQDEAKKKICVAVYNHYKRLKSNQAVDDVEIEKSNVIIVGSTGTGKCVTGDTVVTIRDCITGKIKNVTINDFIEHYIKA